MASGPATAARVVEVGLASVLLAIPSSVLTGVMGSYDEPKAWALVALVGFTFVAWLVGRALGARSPTTAPDPALRAVRWTLLAYGGWSVLATSLSVAPGQSLWGGFGRGFGLVTLLAALVLFFVVQAEVGTLDRARSLIDLALVGSVPVVAIALMQALGAEPFPIGWDPATEDLLVRSTFGQHIFLGSYLVVLIPLGVGRIMTAQWQRSPLRGLRAVVAGVWALGTIALLAWTGHGVAAWAATLVWSVAGAAAWSVIPSSPAVSLPPWWRFAILGSLLAAQGVTLVLSTARGALLGLVTGLAAAAMVLLVARGHRRALVVLGSGILVIIAFVGLLNVRGTPLDALKDTPAFWRLGSITELRAGSPGWVRLRLWQGILSHWPRQLAGEGVMPGFPPTLRALIGYGPESQILILDRFLRSDLKSIVSRRRDVRARYTFDRAHNEPLDHLVTTGLIGMLLWLGVLGAIMVTGVMRLRSSRGTIEAGIRLGCLAAVIGQVVEGVVGIASPMPRALFWMAAALLTGPCPMPAAESSPARIRATARRRSLAPLAIPLGALVLVLVALAGSTRSLLGSMAYSAGIRQGLARDLRTARQDFLRATRLAPWIPFPAEAVADVSMRLATAEPRVEWLDEAQDTLLRARRYVPGRGDLWRLSAQIEIARVRDGRPERFGQALRDFAEAARLNPGDPDVLGPWAMALVQSGDLNGARRLAEEALGADRAAWQGWAVLARIDAKLGNISASQSSAERARRVVPPDSRALLESLLP